MAERPPPRANRRPVRAMSAQQRRRARDIIVLLIIVALAGTVIYLSPAKVADALTSGTAVLVYCVMVAEFLLIKSADRTRIYRLENQRLRERRRELELLVGRARAILTETPPDASAPPADAESHAERLKSLLSDIDALL